MDTPTNYTLLHSMTWCLCSKRLSFQQYVYGPIFMGLKSRIFRQDTLKMDPQMNQEPMISQFWKRRRHYHL